MGLRQTVLSGWSELIAETTRSLQHWPWLDTLRTLRQRFREDHLSLTASSLTFTTTIALVPLVTVMLALFSAFPMFGSFQAALEKYFLQSLVPESIAKPVLQALTQFASQANRLGTAGLVVLVLTAIMLMLTIDRALNAIWRVRTPRPIAQRILVYWAAVTLGPLLLGLSLSFTSYALSASRGLVSALPGGVSVLLDVIEFVMLGFGTAGLYYYVPNTHVRWRHAIGGGVFVAISFELAKRALGWYFAQMPSYSIVYGAFASAPIFLVWVYCVWVIVLLGAVIAAYAPSLSMRVVRRPTSPGSDFALALTLIGELQSARMQGRGGVSSADLAAALRTDPLQIEPMLDTLVELDWAGRLDEGGAQRFALLVDPQATRAAPLLERTLIESTAATRGLWRRASLGEMMLSELLPS